jgi:hypothetical protein
LFKFNGLAGGFDFAHPYIAFQNHSGEALLPEWRNRDASSTTHKFYIDRSASERKKAFNRRDDDKMSEEQLRLQQEEFERAQSGVSQGFFVLFWFRFL